MSTLTSAASTIAREETALAQALTAAGLTTYAARCAHLGISECTLRTWLDFWGRGVRPRKRTGEPSAALAKALARDLAPKVRKVLEDPGKWRKK